MNGVVGIDEVGRGSWAGPLLVVAARAFNVLPTELQDSKQLTRKQRETLLPLIVASCHIGEGWVQAEEIDKFGLTKAMRLGVSRALMDLGALLDDEIIIDGLINYCPSEFTGVKMVAKADSIHPIVSAASVYAKVIRDDHMRRAAKFYPYYGFEKHVGYGTALHKSLLATHGVSKLHRRSYRPVRAYL